MYNYFMLVGRVANDVEVKTTQNRKVANLCIAVQRPFKNLNGDYDTDFLNVNFWESMAEIIGENIKKGGQIGIKGRLVQRKVTLEGGNTINVPELVGERIVFFENGKPSKEAE